MNPTGITATKRLGGAVAATLAAILFALPASAWAATTDYPAGGSGFDGGAQGWVASEESCELLDIELEIGLLCDTTAQFEEGVGNPGGAIAVDVSVLANALTLFEGAALWTSPSFTVPAGATVTGASAHLDRAFDAGGLVDIGPSSEVVVTLVDETDGGSTQLLTETLSGDDCVRVVRGPLSGAAIAALMRSLNLNAEVGNGPGGSLVPLSQCTIIGTSGSDRIVGTPGNDVICGLGGGDVIRGAGGRDVIDGGNGADRLHGGRQGDLMIGLRGSDRLWGAHGHDRIGGGAQGDLIGGGAGNDRLIGRRGTDRMLGGPGHDRLMARDGGRDIVRGGSGRDVAFQR